MNLSFEPTNRMSMPQYSFNSELNCGEIKYAHVTFLCDVDAMMAIINSKQTFVSHNLNYIAFIYDYNSKEDKIIFKNENCNDLRRENVTIIKSYKYTQLISEYDIVEYLGGHKSNMGVCAGQLKNPVWKIKHENEYRYIMYCDVNTICTMCEKSYEIVRNFEKQHGKPITWYCGDNNYILGRLSVNKLLYIHQVITNCYGNGKGTGTISVDHIDRNPLNNTYKNLRIATRKTQEQNSKGIMQNTKRARQSTARALPDGITQDMLRKYVVYNVGYLNQERTKWRDFFTVEWHPALKGKKWTSTKSMKVTVQEKLADANNVVDNLNRGILPESEEKLLPKYIRLTNMRGKPHLDFERRIADKRLSLKMILPDEYDLNEQLELFKAKIAEKYPELTANDTLLHNQS